MSTEQILEEIKSYPTPELESLEHGIRLERLRRTGKIATPEETRLLKRINAPMPHTERFVQLRLKLQDIGHEGISESERQELIEIAEAREGANVLRVEAAMELAQLQGRTFAEVWQQMIGAPKGPRFIVP